MPFTSVDIELNRKEMIRYSELEKSLKRERAKCVAEFNSRIERTHRDFQVMSQRLSKMKEINKVCANANT